MATASMGTNATSSGWAPSYERSANGRLKAVDLPHDQRVYASWIHWASLIAWASVPASGGVSFAIPALVALAMWQIRNRDSEFIDDHGREALNFQISLVVIGLVLIPFVLCGIGVVGLIALSVLAVVGTILGGLAALRSEVFRYPACIRFIKDPTPPVAS
ncbi:MAG: DUF4870 domain-containing protein [Planctomycetota bacterium]